MLLILFMYLDGFSFAHYSSQKVCLLALSNMLLDLTKIKKSVAHLDLKQLKSSNANLNHIEQYQVVAI